MFREKTGGMSNLCCMCEKEIPTQPSGVRHGYCSEECWQQWCKKHKDDAILAPYIPMQMTRLVMDKKP